MITGEQASMARGLLGWSLMRLSGYCGVSDAAIQNFERGKIRRPAPDVEAIQRALEIGGVDFMRAQPMVRLREKAAVATPKQ
jgi:transcriptional regulator with XRE-family HTH domain